MKRMEKEIIKQSTGENIILEVQEKTSKLKVLMYILLAAILLFAIHPTEVTLLMALLKIFFIIGVYAAEESLKTKLYFSGQGVYMVERFKNKRLIGVRQFKKTQLYRIDLLENQPGVYRLYFNGKKDFVTNLDVKMTKRDDILLFRKMMKKNLEVYINEPLEIEEHIFRRVEEEATVISKLNKYFAWGIVFFVLFALAKETIFADGQLRSFVQIMAAVIAWQFIPFLLYIISYVYLTVSGKVRDTKDTKVPFRTLFLIYVIGSTTFPFIVLMNHAVIDGTRFATVHLLGLFLIGLCLVVAWMIGKIAKLTQAIRGRGPIFDRNKIKQLI